MKNIFKSMYRLVSGHNPEQCDMDMAIEVDAWSLVETLTEIPDWHAVRESLAFIDDFYESTDVTDPVLVDMQTEESALRRRFAGAIDIFLSEDFKKWGARDRTMFARQLVGMYIYHSQLWGRALRFGVVSER